MNATTVRTLLATGLSAAVLLGAAAITAPAWGGLAQVSAQAPATAPLLPRTITVVGDGVVSIKPDVARANIGVEVLRPSVEEASAENNTVTAAVLAALAEMGIAAEDIQTAGYSVFAERYGSDGMPTDEVKYRVSNTVNVLIRDLDRVGEILDASIQAGANNIYGVEFLLDDPTAARSAARRLAVENARATAAELAELNGVSVGDLISISEVIGGNGGFYSNQFSQYAAGGAGNVEAPIEPGQLRLTLQLQVTYALEE